MKKEIQFFIWSLGIGVALIAYAHANFATKDNVNSLHEDIRIIQADVKDILKAIP